MELFYFGLGIILIAAVFQGSFVVPMAYAKGWKWENSWLLFSILGMWVLNWLLAAISVPNLLGIYMNATPYQLLIPIIFGFRWGMGAFIPMLCLYPADLLTLRGMVILAGLVVTLFGISLGGVAGRIKEREQGQRSGEITKITNLSPKIGFLICLVAGVFSSLTQWSNFRRDEFCKALARQDYSCNIFPVEKSQVNAYSTACVFLLLNLLLTPPSFFFLTPPEWETGKSGILISGESFTRLHTTALAGATVSTLLRSRLPLHA